MSSSGETFRRLAAVADTEPSVRAALMRWDSACAEPVIRQVSSRARIGAPLDATLEPLRAVRDGSLAARAIAAHARHGGSLAATMMALADAQDTRRRSTHEALMAGSASKLSSRLLAALGLTGVLLMPGGRSSVQVTVASMGLSLFLAGIGSAWMRRITPRPPVTDPPAAALADLTAGLIDAGLHPALALDLACPGDLPARRLVRLGMDWSAALTQSDEEDLVEMARVLRMTSASGATSALRRFARSLRERRRRECEMATHRAPVLLVLPLTLCFLPAFALLLVGPMLEGLSG